MRTRVYISGPITLGHRPSNLRQATDAMRALLLAGFAPFCPHLSLHLPWEADIPHADWLAMDLPWVAASQAVLRLLGESVGADREVATAMELEIPVFYSVGALLEEMQ